jgi:hypothetical protein
MEYKKIDGVLGKILISERWPPHHTQQVPHSDVITIKKFRERYLFAFICFHL